MSLEMFYHHFPDLARQETRAVTVKEGDEGDVPPGLYALMECYCVRPTCDCRRVLLQVYSPPTGLVAAIGYGFDRDRPLAGPMLDPLHPRPPYGEALLKLVDELCLHDPEYVARLERHYHMMREKVAREQDRGPWWKRKPKKPKRGPRP